MSDTSKAEKLAAAKRKLKEFQNQQKNKENHANSTVSQNPQAMQQRILQRDSSPLTQEVPTSAPSECAANSFSAQQEQQQQISLANYFSNSNRNEFFFDNVHKHVNGDTSSPIVFSQKYVNDDVKAFPSSRTEIPPASSLFPSNSDSSFLLTNTDTDQVTDDANAEMLNSLRLELERANSKIKMQADALDIITAAKEDLQTKLTKAIQEIDSYKCDVQSLSSQLEENLISQRRLQIIVDELKRFKEGLSTKELATEQTLNDLKERNDELYQSLVVEKDANKMLQSQVDETRSNYSLLSLKFQQLGIEVTDDGDKDYKSVYEECELWRRKYEELENRLKATIYEKERTEDEYRQFIVNLKEELENTNVELHRLTDENQTLADKISSQTEHISGLERQLQKISPDANKDTIITELRNEILKLREEKKKNEEANERLNLQLADYGASNRRIYELESEIENLKADMTNAHELQIAVESNKVAASQAIAQNSKLKNEFEQLHQLVQILNEEKIMLSKILEEEKTKNATLTSLAQNESDNYEITTNDAAINTDDGEEGESGISGKANLEAMLLLQEKFKNVLDKMADLTDEKQQLEHLVMQLQCETETIEEYVALYQKQRSVLQQRARETDLKMERVSQEKERLLNILRSILTADEFDCAFVKQLVENNLSVELADELTNSGATVTDEYYAYDQKTFLPKSDNAHHPSCPCCSGQLITI